MKLRTKNIFSVVVCCYNPSLEKLKKTIISIERQKNVSFDICITDDGSIIQYFDEIQNWIKTKRFENIFFNINKTNNGIVCNIVSALKLVTGIYVKVISPGDYFYDDYSLKKYLDIFQKENADLICCRPRYYTSGSKIIKSIGPRSYFTTKKAFIKRNICLYDDWVTGASFAFKRDIGLDYLQRIVGTTRNLEDIPLIIMLFLENKKVIPISKPLVWYEYGCGISTSNPKGNPLLDKDFDSFFSYVSKNYNSIFSKRMVNFYFCCKIKSKFLKNFFRCVYSPGYLLFRFFSLFHTKQKAGENESLKLEAINKESNFK